MAKHWFYKIFGTPWKSGVYKVGNSTYPFSILYQQKKCSLLHKGQEIVVVECTKDFALDLANLQSFALKLDSDLILSFDITELRYTYDLFFGMRI